MQSKKYEELKKRQLRDQEIYRLYTLEGLKVSEIGKQLGLNNRLIYRSISIFEQENPEESRLMKRQGKDVSPEDYKVLQQEISNLKKKLSEERLRADFYQEMVAYGKEIYGIDLKKVGTK